MRTILAALIVSAALIAAAFTAAQAAIHETGHVCFPEDSWNADDGDRPCLHVVLYEDGTYRGTVEQADGDRWRQR